MQTDLLDLIYFLGIMATEFHGFAKDVSVTAPRVLDPSLIVMIAGTYISREFSIVLP